MKILAIGDFHGKFPVKLRKLVGDVDLVLSVGDYCSFSDRKLWFKCCYGGDKELWEVVGKRRVKEGMIKDLKSGENILRVLSKLKVPVVSVIGNLDYTRTHDTFDEKHMSWKRSWKWEFQDFFSPILKKYSRIKRVDYLAVKIGELVIIGGYGHSFPGRVKSKAYRRSRKKLDKLFKKYAKENREGRVVFLFHNMPYDCKLDKIRDPGANSIARGKHYGNKLTRRIIDRYQPVLCIGGHMHENQGKCKIGKSLVVNGGAAMEGKAAVIDFDSEKGKVKSVKFVG